MAVYLEDGEIPDLMTCPFNSNHRVAARRYQMHVAYCAEHTGLAGMATCKFNSSHFFIRGEEKEHLAQCEDHLKYLRTKVEAGMETDDPEAGASAGSSCSDISDPAPRPPNFRRDLRWDQETDGKKEQPVVCCGDDLWSDWRERCFDKDGLCIKRLTPVTIGFLTPMERDEYYRKLEKSGKLLRDKKANEQQQQQPKQPTPLLGDRPGAWDWGATSAPSMRSQLMAFAQNTSVPSGHQSFGRGRTNM